MTPDLPINPSLDKGKKIMVYVAQDSLDGNSNSVNSKEDPARKEVLMPPIVANDIRILGKIWENKDAEEPKNYTTKDNNVDEAVEAPFTLVLSKSKRKKQNRRKKQVQVLKADLNHIRTRAGPKNFAQ